MGLRLNGVSMSGEMAAARSHPAVIVSMVVAALAVTACALVAIATGEDAAPRIGIQPTR